MLTTPTMVSGEAAVERAAAESFFGEAEVPLALSGAAADVVRLAGSRTFRLVDGVWIDTAFDPDTMTTIKVPFLSEDYFALADARPDLGDAFALGSRVIAFAGGEAYEVVGAEETGDPVTLPPTIESQEVHDLPTEVSPISPTSSTEQDSGFSLPCPGFAIVIGLAVVPLVRRRRSI